MKTYLYTFQTKWGYDKRALVTVYASNLEEALKDAKKAYSKEDLRFDCISVEECFVTSDSPT